MFINTYLYSVYGSVKAKTRKDPNLIDYRNRWLKALLVGSKVEAVVALGQAADEAWQFWKATPEGQSTDIAYRAVTHPTQPESSSEGDKTKLAAATKKLLQNWNAALQILSPQVQHPDVPTPLVLYGESWVEGDRVGIPGSDLPAGLPAWMHEAGRLGEARGGRRPRQATQYYDHCPKGGVGMTDVRRRWYPLAGDEPSARGAAGAIAKAAKKRADRPAHRPEAGAGGTRGHHG